MSHSITEQDSSNKTEQPQSTVAFITDYLPLACFLTARKHLVSLEATNSRTILFVFEPSPSLSQDIADFNDRKGLVEPTTYDAARIQLRKRMDVLKGGRR